jgi:hypothetical protein
MTQPIPILDGAGLVQGWLDSRADQVVLLLAIPQADSQSRADQLCDLVGFVAKYLRLPDGRYCRCRWADGPLGPVVQGCIVTALDVAQAMVHLKLQPPDVLVLDCLREQGEATLVSAPRKTRMRLLDANDKAIALARQNRAFLRRSLREWAQAIGCSTGLVARLPLWIRLRERKRQLRGQGKSPPTVSLTPGLEAVVGGEDTEGAIRQLIEEQREDFEPSPLEEDPVEGWKIQVRERKRL